VTAQEIFETVVKALALQGKPSKTETGGCYYRNVFGMKCAVGVLIPDEDYDPVMEGANIHGLMNMPDLPESLKFMMPHQNLLFDLQIMHDNCYEAWNSMMEFKLSFKKVGDTWDLSSEFMDGLVFGSPLVDSP
jgi:hypothetical protein